MGNERKIKIRIQEKGFYLISCKAFGYMGGNYILSTAISDVAVGNEDANGAKVILPPGHMAYGQTVGGVINETGQVEEWKFNGELNDKIFIGMGPGFQPKTPGDLSRCGKPYGKGQTCIDSHLVLVSPSGKVEASNHLGFQNDFQGSMIGTFMVAPNPYVSESEEGSYFTERKSLPHVLQETGEYTIRAGSSPYTDDEGQRIQNVFSPYGEYFLQIISVGKHTDPMKPQCPILAVNASKGFDEPGCPNYVWATHNQKPRLAEKHKNCEKWFPIGPLVGSNTIDEGLHRLRNWKLQKTGKYIVRVRSAINNCFREQIGPYGQSDFVCRPSAGAFDLKIKVRDSPEANVGTLPPKVKIYPSATTYTQNENITVAELGKTYGISHTCGTTSTMENGACWREMIHGKDPCDDSYKYIDTVPDTKMTKSAVTRFKFNGTAGDVMCITAKYPSSSMTGTVAAITKLELKQVEFGGGHWLKSLLSDQQFKWGWSYIEYGDGIAIKGYKLPASATYEVWVHGGDAMESYLSQLGFSGISQITIDKCPAEFKTINDEATSCGDPFVGSSTFDKCVSSKDVVFSNDDRKVTFPKDQGTSIVISKIGIPVTDATNGNDKPRYYWEVTVGGNPKEKWVNYQSAYTVVIGLSTRDYNNQGLWLGGDNQAFSYGNGWESGKWYSDGASSDYGNMFLPGDTVSFAFDTNSNRIWVAINGTWQATSTGFDVGGTRYNNYPEATASTWDCKPTRHNETLTATQIAQYGQENCPIPKGKPRCAGDDWISGKQRPSCSHGNPVSDGQCTVGSYHTWYGQHSKKIASTDFVKLKADPFSSSGEEVKLYPAVQGDGKYDSVSYEANFGDSPFKYQIPCSFQALTDVLKETPSGPVNSDCWTCKGKCAVFDSSPAPGSHTCVTYDTGAGTDQYYWDYYGMLSS